MSRAALALALLLALAAGCRSAGPVLRPLAPGDARPERWLEELRERSAARRAVRGRAKVSLSGRRGEGFAKQVVVVERPARMRVEVLGLLGRRVAVLATDGERYQLFRSETGRIESGEVTPGILWRVAGVPLSPRQAVDALLGAPAGAAEAGSPVEAAGLEGGGLRVELAPEEGAARRALTFDARGRLRRWVLRDAEGRALLEIRYDDYREVAGQPFAHRVAVDSPAGDARAELSFRDVELNPALPEGIFRLRPAAARAPRPGRGRG